MSAKEFRVSLSAVSNLRWRTASHFKQCPAYPPQRLSKSIHLIASSMVVTCLVPREVLLETLSSCSQAER